ncbi:LysE family translocator [Verticiella sediminum]|uniref:LysE family translocator n=1 Tax=Verticiella sediminum TaxID=1247510 RepID=A0A556AIG8_9BURK|nr:LysE family translocator [Verticiella sediminum]TSH92671.1 LysE family translocator [Verticiella sediminum]
MSLLPFFIAAIALAITPGPGMAYVVGMLHVAAAALGLSLLIAQSAVAFIVLKYVGAAYLVYLGIRALVQANRRLPNDRTVSRGMRRALLEGALVEAMNVKTALFFLAFLPQFVSPSEPLAGQLVMLGTVCLALNTLVDTLAVLGAHRLLRSDAMRVARARLLARLSYQGLFFAEHKIYSI